MFNIFSIFPKVYVGNLYDTSLEEKILFDPCLNYWYCNQTSEWASRMCNSINTITGTEGTNAGSEVMSNFTSL